MLSIIPSAIGVLLCGLCGAVIAWTIVDSLGWTGVGGAIVTAIIGMVSATLLWIALVVLRNSVRRK